MKTKPEIIYELILNKNELVKMHIKKIAVKIGSGAHILVPKSLIGKYVTVIYNGEESEGK